MLDETDPAPGSSLAQLYDAFASRIAAAGTDIHQLRASIVDTVLADMRLQEQLDALRAGSNGQGLQPATPDQPLEPSKAGTAISASTEDRPGCQHGVLVVDDSKLMRLSLTRLVQNLGYTVLGEADNGEFAVGMAINLRPAVVILDHAMAGMNGLECAGVIMARCPRTKIVMLSSTIDPETALKYTALGVGDLLPKPVQTAELLRVLVEHMGPPKRIPGH